MSTIVHGFDWPDRFVVGTVGQPGERTFYLQARAGQQLVSVAMEKEQSAALAARIDEILDELMAEGDNTFSVPSTAPDGLNDHDPLETPIEEQFRVGVIGLGWDPQTAQVVIEAFAYSEEDDSTLDPTDGDPSEAMVVRIPVGSARAFAKRTREVVGAGRPRCALCGEPMDSADHVCTLPEDFG